MSSNTSSGNGGGIGCLGLLQIVLIVLKLLEKIDLSWWVVFIPTYLGIAVMMLIIFLAVVIAALQD